MGALGFSQAPSCLKAPHPSLDMGREPLPCAFVTPGARPLLGKDSALRKLNQFCFSCKQVRVGFWGRPFLGQELPSFAHTVAPVLLEAVKEMLLPQDLP